MLSEMCTFSRTASHKMNSFPNWPRLRGRPITADIAAWMTCEPHWVSLDRAYDMNYAEQQEASLAPVRFSKRLMSNKEVWVLFHWPLLQLITLSSLIHLASGHLTPGSLPESLTCSFSVSVAGFCSCPNLKVGMPQGLVLWPLLSSA